MTRFFNDSPMLSDVERQMQQPPGYRPRGNGLLIIDEVEWKSRGSYEEIVDIVISRMQLENLKRRIDHIFFSRETELMFRNRKHREDFYALMKGKRRKPILHTSKYSAAVFLLSSDERLWERVKGNVLDTGVYFDRIRLSGVTLEQYILFHAARDVYLGTKHIRLSELTDRELISDELLKIIVNAFVIRKCGIEVIEWEG